MKNKTKPTRKELAQKHSLLNELSFRAKTRYLILKRMINNGGVKTFACDRRLWQAPIVGQSVSELWNRNDNKENWIMTAGKIQNLRIAAAQINGTTIPAGEVFSFWKYVKQPTKRNGYVVGREIREGCIVPSIAGGICQLSNALYDAALKAGFEIVERHQHSKVVKGSLAEQQRDATVKWNYIDLRFKADSDFSIFIEMDAHRLSVSLRSKQKKLDLKTISLATPLMLRAVSPLNDCLSCRNTDCYICNTNTSLFDQQSACYVLDERCPEYEDYINARILDQDFVLPAFSPFWARLLKQQHRLWNIAKGKKSYYTRAAISRLINYHRTKPQNIFSWQLQTDEQLARKLIKRIPIQCTHLVVSQNLLPFLHKYYAFAGRSYEVLMSRSAVGQIQSELDEVLTHYPTSTTLCDFRASDAFVELENKALGEARLLISPHKKVASAFDHAELIGWKYPHTISPQQPKGKQILFPASPLARKGAYELRKLMRELNIEVLIKGKTMETPHFFDGLNARFCASPALQDVGLVLLPAYVEHCPRLILKAIAQGIPVVVSDACGIEQGKGVFVFETGNYEAMKKLVEGLLPSLSH